MRLGAAILAGGKSLRMGTDKAIIKYRGQTLLDRLVDEFSSFDELTVSMAHPGDYEVPAGVKVVHDGIPDIGPMEGIRQALLSTECDYVFVCAVDMPFLEGDLARYIGEFISSDHDCYVIKDDEHIQPLCAIYSRAVLPVIEMLVKSGRYRLTELLNAVRTKYIELSKSAFSKKQVTNVNTKQELEMAVRPAVFCVCGGKDSGKTWLISRLINEFISIGLSVGVIKHDGHDYTMDHEGSDTCVFTESGAAYSAIYSGSKYSLNVSGAVDADELRLKCPDTDVVIYEGRKDSALPKLWTVREGGRCAPEPSPPVFGVVADSHSLRDEYSRHGFPVFDPGDINAICSHIRDYFLIG